MKKWIVSFRHDGCRSEIEVSDRMVLDLIRSEEGWWSFFSRVMILACDKLGIVRYASGLLQAMDCDMPQEIDLFVYGPEATMLPDDEVSSIRVFGRRGLSQLFLTLVRRGDINIMDHGFRTIVRRTAFSMFREGCLIESDSIREVPD